MLLHYCNAFKFCRMTARSGGAAEREAAAATRGPASGAVEREIPREIQWQARQQILVATAADAGPAERMARAFLPTALL